MVVQLGDGEGAVQHQPVDQVRQLAQPAPDASAQIAAGDGQSFLVALAAGGVAHRAPEGKGLARGDDQPVHLRGSQLQIAGLALLQPGGHPSQPAADHRAVALHQSRQRLGLPGICEPLAAGQVPHPAQKPFLAQRDPVAHRTVFTKQFSLRHGVSSSLPRGLARKKYKLTIQYPGGDVKQQTPDLLKNKRICKMVFGCTLVRPMLH